MTQIMKSEILEASSSSRFRPNLIDPVRSAATILAGFTEKNVLSPDTVPHWVRKRFLKYGGSASR